MFQAESKNEGVAQMHPDRQQRNNERRDERRRGGGEGKRDRRGGRRNNEKFINPNDSVLHMDWNGASRPYSQRELINLEEQLFTRLQVSDELIVRHAECGHTYRVKKNGVRYKQLLEEPIPEEGYPDVGNCSVCWKKHKTPRNLKSLVDDFITVHDEDLEDSERKTLYSYEVKRIFYSWLYNEMYY